MNNTTKIIEMLVDVAVPATSHGAGDCFGLGTSDAALSCTGTNLKTSLQNSVPGWNVATVVFRLIGVVWFLRASLKGIKEIMAGTIIPAAKTFGFAAITLFLLFDIGNTIGYLLNLREFFANVFTRIQGIIDSNNT